MKYFDNTPIGTLVTRSISDIETIADIFSQGLLVIIAELLKLIVVVSMMFYVDWRLALIAMLTIPVLLVATSWFKRNIKASFQDVRTTSPNKIAMSSTRPPPSTLCFRACMTEPSVSAN
jgi:ATP-binding cassette subfamily B protein